MKILLLFLSLICASPFSAHSYQDKGLRVSLSSVRSERSRDSGSTTITINVDNQTLTYDETRTGMRRIGGPVHKKYLLTDEEVLKLKRLVREKNLLVSGSSEYPTSNPPFVLHKLSVEVSLDGKQSQIKASGPPSSEALRNDKLYKKANALFEELMSILNAHEQPAPKE